MCRQRRYGSFSCRQGLCASRQDNLHTAAVPAPRLPRARLFAHKDKLCSPFKKRVHDPSATYDAYDESDDTEENAKHGLLKGVGGNYKA